MDKAVTYNLINVEIGTTRGQMNVAEEHLYGRFFDDRAEFYIVEHPELYIGNTEVNRLTLYFIDGTLCKKKYELGSDIGSELMKSYGGFKFKALNTQTQESSRSEKIVVETKNGHQINENLNRYQMKWHENEEVMIRYIVFNDSTRTERQLVEELTAYSQILRQAELDI